MDLRIPPIRYADNDGIEIAYQVIGDSGPVFMGIPGLAQNIELMWEEPHAARFLRRLGSFCRLIHFDKRGTGLSGRSSGLSSFPDRVTVGAGGKLTPLRRLRFDPPRVVAEASGVLVSLARSCCRDREKERAGRGAVG